VDTTVKASGSAGPDGTGTTQAQPRLQPFLHDACVTVRAPSLGISRPDGQITGGADGFYHGDRRALSLLEVEAEGVPNAPVGGGLRGADGAAFRTLLRGLAEHSPDPAVCLERVRGVAAGRMTETLEIVNHGRSAIRIRLTVRAASDLAAMETVKTGLTAPALPATATGPGELTWSDAAMTVRLTATPAPDALDAAGGRLHYDVELGPASRWQAELSCTAAFADGDQFPAPPAARQAWSRPELSSADHRLDRWVRQSHLDLRGLLLTDPLSSRDVFLAAGAPWFLTLFGRDSLWAARMLLPLGTDLAAGTLRVLARRQGTRVDPATEEQPGKILHEVRRAPLHLGDTLSLPPLYYGTVDATALWIVLLHDAWRWGMTESRVEPLLGNLEAALEWMDRHGDADGDGFLEYVDSTGRGLANQGWKDSGDAVRRRDGRLAGPPVALCEVQGYAHEAALAGAALLRAFGRPGADRWEEWAGRLRDRFRERFWVEDADGPYPAIALDGEKRPMDALTSNIGHLLGTGLLDREECALVAARLAGPQLDCGFGLRTLAADSAGFSPFGYHIGTVWPHDTAITAHGLAREGFPEAAAALVSGLVAASVPFEARLPELFAGHGSTAGTPPAPYPAACRPQAWAAAASVHCVSALLGLEADVPRGRLTVAAEAPADYRPLRVRGLEMAGRPLEVTVDAGGAVHAQAPAGIEVCHPRP
jgi:glycogen debranching enzyme